MLALRRESQRQASAYSRALSCRRQYKGAETWKHSASLLSRSTPISVASKTLARHHPSASVSRHYSSSTGSLTHASQNWEQNNRQQDNEKPKQSTLQWQFIISFGVAGTSLIFLMKRPPILNEQSEPTAPPLDHMTADSPLFAQSVEDVEDEEKRLHRNGVMRAFYKVGTFLQDYLIEPLGTTKRFIVLVFLFAPVILSMPMLLVGKRREGGRLRGRRMPKAEGGTRWGAKWWYSFLVKQMERAGPTFIKLAQWAGSRQDLFPKELCDLLGKLHSNGKPHSLKHTKKVIQRVFGKPFEEIFEYFPDEPLGIGAVAQVSSPLHLYGSGILLTKVVHILFTTGVSSQAEA